MCGITGVVELRPEAITPEEFDQFTDSLRHRGPDGRGVHREKGLYLGHRRLKILDMSPSGAQPMSDLQKRYWITFNGEIYNFLELRKELGGEFRTASDTEVILAAYARWGVDCQQKLNGMWAFAIWDAQEKTLFLSRDRFGVKPLYIAQNNELFAFASEIKAFLFLPSLEIEPDNEAIGFSLRETSLLEPSPYTFLKGVLKIQAGHCAIFRDGKLHVKRWWNTLDHLQPCALSFQQQTEQLLHLFEDACRIRLRSDVPLGCALSGGLDSSSVATMMARLGAQKGGDERRSPDWQRAFTASYPGTSQDEKCFADTVIQSAKLQAYYIQVEAKEVVDHLEECLYTTEDLFELPIGPWLLYRKFREQGTVISIDGHGVDELFGGYHHQVGAYLSQTFSPNVYRILKELYPPNFPGNIPTFANALAKGALRGRPTIQRTLVGLFRRFKGRKDWIQTPFETAYEKASACFQAPKSFSYLNQILFEDFHRRTLPAILRNFDRCSMAHGIEVRAPFLDWRIVCSAFSLPDASKIGDGFTKRIVREMMKGILPETIRCRTTKIGFANPLVEWLKTSLKEYVLDTASSQSFLTSTIWNGPGFLKQVEEGYAMGHMGPVRQAWEALQMDRLLKSFQSVRKQVVSRC